MAKDRFDIFRDAEIVNFAVKKKKPYVFLVNILFDLF